MSGIPDMNDEELGECLRTLPRSQATEGFTGRVLSEVDESLAREAARRASSRRLRLMGAAAACVLGLGLAGWFGYGQWVSSTERMRAASRVEQLRNEYREIQGELQKLRELADELSPTLELGGNEELGFVFDMRELDPSRQTGTRPASLQEPGSF